MTYFCCARLVGRVFCLSLIVLVPLTALKAQSQTSKPTQPATRKANSVTPAAAPAAPGAAIAQAGTSSPQASQAGLPSSSEYPADYIPCVFTLPELLGLRLTPVSATLTSAEAEDLKEQLISEVTAQTNNGGLTPSMKSEFIESLGTTSFEGLTPSQALAKVISILHEIEGEAIPIEQLEAAASDETVTPLLNLVKLQLPMGSLTPKDLQIVETNLSKAVVDDMKPLDRVIQLEANVSAALSGVNGTYYEFPGPIQNLTRNLQAVAEDLADAASKTVGTNKNSSAGSLNAQDIAIQAIVERARNNIKQAFQRPLDVGCAMSILSWNEVRFAFGRLIANEYVGVQIVVRNLNDKQEFSLHDAELSVDTDINGRYGRFYSGRDKLIVRGLSLAQADFTPRNLVVHVAEAAGTIMSAALPVAGTVFKDAVGVYNGGFLPGLKSTWTDHSVDQLNLLSDIGFSSSTNYKTVVPKSGSVMFVIFIPSKQFEEGWWVQKCSEHISLPPKAIPPPTFAVFVPSPSQPKPPDVGIDLEAARELCRTYGQVATPPTEQNVSPTNQSSGLPPPSTPSPDQISQPTFSSVGRTPQKVSTSELPTVLSVSDVPYRKWSPVALSIFRELAWAVVAGTHIQETQNQSAITQLNCPANDLGNLLFNKTGTLSCDVTGEGLDKIATLRLRNAQDATDTDTADAPVTVSGDATKAKATFQLSKLGALNKPAYKVYTVTSTGVEGFANQTIHLDLNPFVTDLSPATGDPSKQSSISFTLKGFHLDKIAKVQLFEGTYKSGATPLLQYDLDSGGTTAQAAFTVKATDDDLKKKASEGSGEMLAVELVVKNVSGGPVDGGAVSLKSTSLLSSETLNFDPQDIKTTSAAKTVTLTNSSASTLTNVEVKISGANPNSFTEKNNCGNSVAANAKCDFTLTFTPLLAGKSAATLTITYVIGGSPQSASVNLLGTGKAATVTLSTKSLTFSPQRAGTDTSAKVVTITNSGSTALTNFDAKIAGANANSFSETNSCGNSIAANAKCTVTLKFGPPAAGKFVGALSITYVVGGSQQSESVNLLGTGIQ